MINVGKLTKELIEAGIKTCGCNSKGVVWDDENKEVQDRAEVKAIIIKHDPTPIPVETLEEKIVRIVKAEIEAEVVK